MIRSAILLLAAGLLLPTPASAADAPAADDVVHMPAGARPTYFGIHGGTMPVSLRIADDGSALVGFVGRTGDDFLALLRRADGAGAAADPDDDAVTPFAVLPPVRPLDEAAALAGRGVLPVFHSKNGAADRLLPFGFSEKPLHIEGDAVLPGRTSPAGRPLLFETRHLRPQERP